MKLNLSPTRGLLAILVTLLAVNVIVMLARPGSAQPDHMMPHLPASGIARLDGPMVATTSQNGDVLYIWQLNRFVNNRYEVSVNRYTAD